MASGANFPMSDEDMRKRLKTGLAALNINMKQASLAAGLSHTYCRDVIERGRGKYENLERVATATGLSWEWLRTGNGDMLATSAKPGEDAKKILIEDMEAAFCLLGATRTQASDLAKLVADGQFRTVNLTNPKFLDSLNPADKRRFLGALLTARAPHRSGSQPANRPKRPPQAHKDARLKPK